MRARNPANHFGSIKLCQWWDQLTILGDGSWSSQTLQLQPIWKIWSSNWNISPGRGEHKKYLKSPVPSFSLGSNPTVINRVPILPPGCKHPLWHCRWWHQVWQTRQVTTRSGVEFHCLSFLVGESKILLIGTLSLTGWCWISLYGWCWVSTSGKQKNKNPWNTNSPPCKLCKLPQKISAAT